MSGIRYNSVIIIMVVSKAPTLRLKELKQHTRKTSIRSVRDDDNDRDDDTVIAGVMVGNALED